MSGAETARHARLLHGASPRGDECRHRLALDKGGRHVHAVALELSANTQQYTSDAVLLSLLPTPTFGAYSPSSGATKGDSRVTLLGTNLRFGSDYQLDYNGTLVNATYALIDGRHDALLTITPPTAIAPQASSGPAPVRVSARLRSST